MEVENLEPVAPKRGRGRGRGSRGATSTRGATSARGGATKRGRGRAAAATNSPKKQPLNVSSALFETNDLVGSK